MANILIIEDNEQNLYLESFILEKHGHKVTAARDGAEGITLAEETRPALILLDIQLPVMDGLSATRLIKSGMTTRNIPVVAATAYAMQGDEGKAIEAGCDGYITKPIDIRVLLKTVEKYLSANNERKIVLGGSGQSEKRQS
jgi:two-component system, cell cycle response regulator DivK